MEVQGYFVTCSFWIEPVRRKYFCKIYSQLLAGRKEVQINEVLYPVPAIHKYQTSSLKGQ